MRCNMALYEYRIYTHLVIIGWGMCLPANLRRSGSVLHEYVITFIMKI